MATNIQWKQYEQYRLKDLILISTSITLWHAYMCVQYIYHLKKIAYMVSCALKKAFISICFLKMLVELSFIITIINIYFIC